MADKEKRLKNKKVGAYQVITASVDPDKEPIRTTWDNQPYFDWKKFGKRSIAGTAAAALTITGVASGVAIYDKVKSENIDKDTAEENQGYLDYVLNEEFYISDAEVEQAIKEGNETIVTVDEVVKDINENIDLNVVKSYVEKGTNQKQDNVNLKNVINYYNGTIERADYSSDNAEAIFRETQAFVVTPYSMFSQNAIGYAEAKASLLGGEFYNGTFTNKKVVAPGAILESKGDIKKLNEAFANNLNEQLSDIILYNDQMKTIKNQIKSLKASDGDNTAEIKVLEGQLTELNTKMNADFDENAEAFYKLFEDVVQNNKLNGGQKSIYYQYIKAVASDYKLASNQLEKINKEWQSFLGNDYFFDALKKILTEEEYANLIALFEKDGNFGKPITPLEEKYKPEDASKANSIVETPKNSNEKYTVKKGGNKISNNSGKREQINKPSQTTETQINVEKVPEAEETKNDKVVVEAGGKVVEEKTEVKEQEKTPIKEEIINPGQEEVDIFTDANREDFEGVYSEEDFAMVLNNR